MYLTVLFNYFPILRIINTRCLLCYLCQYSNMQHRHSDLNSQILYKTFQTFNEKLIHISLACCEYTRDGYFFFTISVAGDCFGFPTGRYS